MIKKTTTLVLFSLCIQASIAAKSLITHIRNTSPFYVTYHSSDPAANTIVNKKCILKKNLFIVGPHDSVSLEDAVIPPQSGGGLIKVTVNGVDTSGKLFTAAEVTLQDRDGDIWFDTKKEKVMHRAGETWFDTEVKREKVIHADTYTLQVDKNGKLSLLLASGAPATAPEPPAQDK